MLRASVCFHRCYTFYCLSETINMFLHGLAFLSSMFIHKLIWLSFLSCLGCLMTLGCSCLPEMLGMSPRLVDCGLLWKVKLGSWIVWFRCRCHGRFPLFPLGCPFCCFRVPKSMQIFSCLAHVRYSSFHCAYCPRNIS